MFNPGDIVEIKTLKSKYSHLYGVIVNEEPRHITTDRQIITYLTLYYLNCTAVIPGTLANVNIDDLRLVASSSIYDDACLEDYLREEEIKKLPRRIRIRK
jgi:hypothetical protein